MRTIAAFVVASLLSASPSIAQSMNASWYGPGFQGHKMANGKRYDMYAFTVAHKTLRLGTRVCITNKRGVQVKGYVTDRGPYVRGRDIDLSYALAQRLGVVATGTAWLDVIEC